ncbi:hypothetical protein OSTOST_00900 [Ostertagia ostertagi]
MTANKQPIQTTGRLVATFVIPQGKPHVFDSDRRYRHNWPRTLATLGSCCVRVFRSAFGSPWVISDCWMVVVGSWSYHNIRRLLWLLRSMENEPMRSTWIFHHSRHSVLSGIGSSIYSL